MQAVQRIPRARTVVVLAHILIGGTIAVAMEAPAADTPWTLRARRAYVSPDTKPIDRALVSVAGERIVAVRGNADARKGVQQAPAQCQDGVVLAGFQNSHVHFTGPEFEHAADASADDLNAAIETMLTRYGFTTVVDTGSLPSNTHALRDRIEAGELTGPRIYMVGQPMYPPNGIPVYLKDLPREILDQLAQPATPDEARRIVRANIDGGADGTKLFVTTPQADRSRRRMPLEIARAAIELTHREHKLAMAHPTDAEGIRTAIGAGVDVLVHTTLGETAPWPDDLVRELLAKNVALIPTLKLWGYELDKGKVPESVQQRLVGASLVQLATFAMAGGEVLFGTDVGYMTEFDPTEEYALMSQAGLTPMQILASLTTAPAKRWRQDGERGRIAAGMRADLVILDADPAQDVGNLAKVRCTFRDGRLLYSRR